MNNTSLGIFGANPQLPADYWTSLAPDTRRVEIEIGPGDGRFLARAAAANASTLFVGFEASRSRASRIENRDNLRVFALDGRWLVSHLLAPGSIDTFHIYFPDPWWKKRHYKRRLFTAEFCTGLWRALRPKALLYLMTDVGWQFEEITGRLLSAGFEAQAWQGATGPMRTGGSYECKYRHQGRRIYEASFLRGGPD